MSVEKRTAELFKDLCDAPTGSVKDDMTIGKLSDSHTDLFIRIIAGHLASKGYCRQEELAKERDNLEYTLTGVMHSVDKWLDGDELRQDEVNRAATMREKTLQIIEGQTREIERLQRALYNSLPSYVQACSEEEAMKTGYERGRAAATKELLDEINKRLPAYRHIKSIDIRSGYTWAIVEVRKMLNKIRKERLQDAK